MHRRMFIPRNLRYSVGPDVDGGSGIPSEPDTNKTPEPANNAALEQERAKRIAAQQALADLEKKLADEKKTETQRSADALAEANAKIAALTLRNDQHEVSLELGLSPKAAEFLRGTTRDELRDSAEKLKALLAEFTPGNSQESNQEQKRGMAPGSTFGGDGNPITTANGTVKSGRDEYRKRKNKD